MPELDAFAERVSERFPKKEPRTQLVHAFTLDRRTGKQETNTEARPVGYVLFTEDRSAAVQAQLDGFAFSKLKPYESWPKLCGDAQVFWRMYVEFMKPTRAVRLAVRYINRIELPSRNAVFKEYILTGPEIADGLPQEITEFFFRVVVPKSGSNMVANISSTIEKPQHDGSTLPYIFDIDAFVPVDLDPDSRDIWKLFEQLRAYKNEIFFLSTTEKAKAMFR